MAEESQKLVSLQIKISKKIYERLKEQLKIFKNHGLQGFEADSQVEDLVLFYIRQFAAGEEQIKKIEDRMQNILEALKDKGVDVLDLFNSFTQKLHDDDSDQDTDVREDSKKMNVEKKKS